MKSKKKALFYRVTLVVDAQGWWVSVERPCRHPEALMGAVTPAEAARYLQERVREGTDWHAKLAAEQHTATAGDGAERA